MQDCDRWKRIGAAMILFIGTMCVYYGIQRSIPHTLGDFIREHHPDIYSNAPDEVKEIWDSSVYPEKGSSSVSWYDEAKIVPEKGK